MRRPLDPWEVTTIRRLSIEWIAEAQRAEAVDCPPPYRVDEIAPEESRAVGDSLRDAIRAMAKRG